MLRSTSNGKKSVNVEDDRLSSLPDYLIHKILAFIDIKHAIQTSVLSSRWRLIWTSMPYLNFSRREFYFSHKHSKFITHVLSGRSNQTEVSSVNLYFYGKDIDVIAQQIMEYAFSHGIQHLNVACFFEKDNVEFPPFLSSSRSLKHLSVTKEHFLVTPFLRKNYFLYAIKTTSNWDFPALTTLHLHEVNLCRDEKTDKCIGFFSECANLMNLTLKGCCTIGFKGLSICLPLLSNLTLDNVRGSVTVFNIVAPQLKNLTISSVSQSYQPIPNHQYLLSTPNLVFLRYNGYYCLQLSTDGFPSLEKADICVSSPKDAHQVLCLLQQFHNVKSLTLNLEIVELLSSSGKLISHQPSPFANLESLKIHPASEYSNVQKHNTGKMFAEVKSYLLDGSPGAIVTMVSREDTRAMKMTRMAQNLITKLKTLLEEEKSNLETIMAEIYEQRKAQVNEVIIGDRYIKICCNYLSMKTETREEKGSDIISKLIEVKEVLGKLPASNRATIQPSFTTLCAEADVVIGKMTDFVKLHFDENRRRLSVCCHELATTFQPSS